MKPYLLFFGSIYYAEGGWNDFEGQYDTLEAARNQASKLDEEAGAWGIWWHILDVSTLSIIEKSERSAQT